MKYLIRFVFPALLVFTAVGFGVAQGDDVRGATGMPIKIGQPVIYGQVEIKNFPRGERRPSISVSLLVNGVQVERAHANDRGYWYFLRRAENGSVLVFEVNGVEVGRDVLSGSGMSTTTRRDIGIDWRAFNSIEKEVSGVVSVKDDYPGRSPQASAEFDRGLAEKKAGNSAGAISIFRSVVANDAKDYVAWTELGTAYFTAEKYSDAEGAYGKALELKPDFMLAIINLGKVQMAQRKFDAAVVTLTKGIQTDPNSADAFHYLGESYLQIKQGSRAVIALNEAIRLAPNEKAELHLRLATLYNAAGAKPQAANEYKLFLEKRPDFKDKDKLEKYIKDNS